MEARGSELWGQKSSQHLESEGMRREARIRSRVKGPQLGWANRVGLGDPAAGGRKICTEHNFVPQI